MLVKLLVNWPIIDVVVRISYRAVANHSSTVPFSFNDATSIISEFSISRKFLPEEVPFVLTVRLLVNHFPLHSQVILVFPFKYVPIIVFDSDLAMKLVILPLPFSDLGSRNHLFQKAFHLIGRTVNSGPLFAYNWVLVFWVCHHFYILVWFWVHITGLIQISQHLCLVVFGPPSIIKRLCYRIIEIKDVLIDSLHPKISKL